MERADRFRKINAPVSAGPDHARKSKDELDLSAGSLSVGASRARSTRVDRGAAARGKNDFTQGNRQSDPGESSGKRSHSLAGGRAARGSDRSRARDRLPDLSFEL